MNTKKNIRTIVMLAMLISGCLLFSGCWLAFG